MMGILGPLYWLRESKAARICILVFMYALTLSQVRSLGFRGLPGTQRVWTRSSARVAPIMSYGDPDLEQKWSQMRVIQDTARMIDEAAYPNDPDVPGLTFLSPVEWAPWMETIWFGNQYEYRSAYFHDVMYSNNKPFREGALLYSDQRKAQEMALLYQRYKKFDTDSYSLPNATFFNVFGAETLRVGRYKVPQGDEVILCTTDPLTFTEMKRYFNSFAPIKWFRSKFMQQKRKRQFIMNIGSDGDGSNVGMLVGGGREAGSFFSACVHKIEHGRWEDSDKKDKYRKGRKIPVQPIGSSSLTFAADRHGRGGMSMPTSVANSQYFVESLIQNVLEYTLKEMGADSLLNLDVYMGGDGRLLNSFMMELSLRVMAGNGVKRVRLAKRGSLTTSEAIAALEDRKSDNQGRSSLALVWTASDREGGLRGNVGLQIVLQKPGAKQEPLVVDENGWKEIWARMGTCFEVSMVSMRPQAITSPVEKSSFCGTSVLSFSPSPKLLASLQKEFDFPALKAFLDRTGFFFTIDCLNGGGGAATRRVLKELGLDPQSVLINDKPRVDSGGKSQDPYACSGDSVDLFRVPVLDIKKILAYPVVDVEADLGSDSDGNEESCPDAGFVFDANAQRYSVLCEGQRLSARESEIVLSALPEQQRRASCALRGLLGWLTVIAGDDSVVENPFDSVRRQVHRVWQSTEGRRLSLALRMTVEESQAVAFINKLRELSSNPNRDWSSVEILSSGSPGTTLAVDTFERSGNQTMSPLDFARSASVKLSAKSSDTALGIADIEEAHVRVSVEGLQEKEEAEDEESDEGEEMDEEEEDDWETRRGLLGAAMGAVDSDSDESENFADVCLEMEVKITPTDSTSLTRNFQSENEIWGIILKNLREVTPDNPLVIIEEIQMMNEL